MLEIADPYELKMSTHSFEYRRHGRGTSWETACKTKNHDCMFSSEVIMAVEVLLSLEMDNANPVGQKSTLGKDVSFIPTGSVIGKSILKQVLRRLSSAKYISVNLATPRRYFLQKNPDQITLLHVIQLFHGDICIGEGYDHYLTRGYEKIPTQSYLQFWRYEKQLFQELHDKFLNTPITDFRHVANPIRMSAVTII